MRKATFILMAALLASATSACNNTDAVRDAGNLVAINSPANGIVRRVLVREGSRVSEGAAIIEIAVVRDGAASQDSPARKQSESRAAVETSLKEIIEAEADLQRALADAQRAEQSVASGFGAQAEVDAARARYQQAQKRLETVREKAQTARDNLTFQRGRSASPSAVPREEIITVRVTATGTIRAISSRVGQQITEGQPLATLSAEK